MNVHPNIESATDGAATSRSLRIPLSALDFDDGVNMRRARKGARADFVANIRAKGILTPLLVREREGRFRVTNGGKRLSALLALKKAGEIGDDYLVPVEVREEDDAEARETSLAANIVCEPPHPVEEYEAFVRLAQDGLGEDEIAARFAKTKKQVQQAFALGALAPEIREVWREGAIARETAEAFTLFDTPAEQAKVFAELSRGGRTVTERDVRAKVKSASKKAAQLVEFVGVEAFAARGGTVIRDLFGSNHAVAKGKSEQLAQEMAREKVLAECERLKGEGWSWAVPADDMPRDAWAAGLRAAQPGQIVFTPEEKARLKALRAISEDPQGDWDAVLRADDEIEAIEKAAALRGYTAKQKAKLGCTVGIDLERSAFEIEYGLALPAAKGAAAADAAPAAIVEAVLADKRKRERTAQERAKARAGKTEEPKEVSGQLLGSLLEQLTRAAAKTLKLDPGFAVDVLLASFVHSDWYGPTAIESARGGPDIGEKWPPAGHRNFAQALALVQRLKGDEKLKWLAKSVAKQLQFDVGHGSGRGVAGPSIAAIVNSLDPKHFNAAMRAEFDAAEYVKHAPVPCLVRAVKETDAARATAEGLATLKRGDLEKLAKAGIAKTGWLPPELRCEGYDGPSAPKSRPAPAKKAKAKKKAGRK